MSITSALLGAAMAASAPPAAPSPPAPPIPSAPLAPSSPEAPPAPPLPPVPPAAFGTGAMEVITQRADGHQTTIVARRDGAAAAAAPGTREVLAFKDPDGRDVRVFSDRAVTRAEVDRMRADARAGGERAREQGRLARMEGERARAEGERARAQAFVIRPEMGGEARAGRDYADLAPRDVRILRRGPGADSTVIVDGRVVDAFDRGPGMWDRPELAELREEIRGLREEVAKLRAELGRPRR